MRWEHHVGCLGEGCLRPGEGQGFSPHPHFMVPQTQPQPEAGLPRASLCVCLCKPLHRAGFTVETSPPIAECHGT